MSDGASREDPLVGCTIADRYVVEARIGEGGMGVVYRAVHQALEREVAIKVLSPQWASEPTATQRFFREARAASAMGHPNIVETFDLGLLEDGRPFMVMPLLRGVELGEQIKVAAPIEPARVVEVLRGVGRALDVMHAKGFVHRDIKPENLFVQTNTGGDEVVKVLDFGVATLSSGASRLTAQGIVTGTPAYMPPEALEGAPPDALADIYALGTVAFEMLTGAVPFDGETPLAILAAKSQRTAPRLRDVCDGSFSDALEAVVARVLDRAPSARFASASAFVDALELAIHDQNIEEAASGSRSTQQLSWHPESVVSEPSVAPERAEREQAVRDPVVKPGTAQSASKKRERWLIWGSALALSAVFMFFVAVEFRRDVAPHTREESPGAATTTKPRAVEEPRAEEKPVVVAGTTKPDANSKDEDASEFVSPRARPNTEGTRRAAGTTEVKRWKPTPPSVDHQRAKALVKQGTRFLVQGQLYAAEDAFRRAAQFDPTSAEAWRGLGLANERLERKDQSIRAYRRYLRVAPNASDTSRIRTRLRDLQAP